MIYFKFDLAESELEKFQDLKKKYDSLGCIRASLIAEMKTPAPLSTIKEIRIFSQTTYSALKVPSVEGEELWIVASALKSNFEKTIGLKASLAEILVFEAEKMNSMSSIQMSVDALPSEGTGVVAIQNNGDRAHSQTIINQLRQSGHLVHSGNK